MGTGGNVLIGPGVAEQAKWSIHRVGAASAGAPDDGAVDPQPAMARDNDAATIRLSARVA